MIQCVKSEEDLKDAGNGEREEEYRQISVRKVPSDCVCTRVR